MSLIWSANAAQTPSLRVAFASKDRVHVDQHLGAAEGFVIYALDAERARLVSVVEFPAEDMDGNENKLTARIDALHGCAAVYCLAVGSSAVRQLVAAGIQPLRLPEPLLIDTLLHSVRTGIRNGGVAWITKALTGEDDARFERMASEAWQE